MGRFFYTTRRDDSARQLFLAGEFDSTLGDREASAGTFRELVLYDNDQVYPEYIILYHRVHAGASESEVSGVLVRQLHLELPIYWRNCHRDAVREGFIHQYRVRKATLQLLQRLLHRSMPEGLAWRVVGARRIENSRLWLRFMGFKDALSRLAESGAAGPTGPEDLAGRQDCGSLCRGTSFEEQAISNEHLEESLNERLLWHGTSRAAAERIAIHDFSIPRAQEATHGRRFGLGVYLAETVDKTLDYAVEEKGVKYVLLCRVACGNLYHTDKLEETDAHTRAYLAGMHTVVADPGGCFAREYVALQTDQIYPEYLLELVEEKAVEPPEPPRAPMDAPPPPELRGPPEPPPEPPVTRGPPLPGSVP